MTALSCSRRTLPTGARHVEAMETDSRSRVVSGRSHGDGCQWAKRPWANGTGGPKSVRQSPVLTSSCGGVVGTHRRSVRRRAGKSVAITRGRGSATARLNRNQRNPKWIGLLTVLAGAVAWYSEYSDSTVCTVGLRTPPKSQSRFKSCPHDSFLTAGYRA